MKDVDKDLLIGCITAVLLLLILVLGIAIPCLVSEKRNIEKEITLKQLEVYGEPVNSNEVKVGE